MEEAGQRLIETLFRPRYLPEIRPSAFNYPVAIHGKMRGAHFVFMTRYRSGSDHNRGEEFDAPFARLSYAGGDRYDLGWFRHTGRWWPIAESLTLEAAIRELTRNGVLHPHT